MISREQFDKIYQNLNINPELDKEFVFKCFSLCLDGAEQISNNGMFGKILPVNPVVLLLYIVHEYNYVFQLNKNIELNDKLLGQIVSISMDKYKFLPLFYNHIYETIGKTKKNTYKYDCMYVGTAHPQKYYDINRMARGLKSVMPNQFIYHYMPSVLKYVYQKVKSPLFRKAKWSEFEHEKVASKELMEIFSDSKCILDAPQAGQVGLTIRTIECLGAKRKLVTTNSDIKNYDFYNENNILIYSEPINLDSPFFKNEYEELSDEMYEKYSLKNWLITMIGKET